MWTRRRFLETASGLPLVGGFSPPQHRPAAAAAARPARDYFRDLGVRPFINAAGTYTAMTASLMPPEVMEAINYASRHYVMLDELHDKVGERIATLRPRRGRDGHLGRRISADPGHRRRAHRHRSAEDRRPPQPRRHEERGHRPESHRFGYEHAVRNCGVTLVEVETPEDVDRAVSGKTAMMLFYNNNNTVGRIQDEAFVRLGKKHGIPTLNDAAADVPPVENLWKYTKMGFDLVAFSGGKGLRGPQSAGLLIGRKDLITAARLNASPNGNTIGRGLKVNKEEMVGMLAALERYLALDHAAEQREFDKRAETIRRSAVAVSGVTAEVFVPEVANHVPHVRISWDAAARGITAADAVKALRDGDPSIGTRSEGPALVVGVWMMQPGDDKVVARRLREVLEMKARS